MFAGTVNLPKPAATQPPEEPILDIEEIPGNIVCGFNKDLEELLLLEIREVALFRRFLGALASRLTSTAEVLAFRRQRREALESQRTLPRSVWWQVAFTHAGLARLVTPGALAEFKDASFVAGLAARSECLGDPPSSSAQWLIGRGEEPMHALVLLAADDERVLAAEVDRVTREAAASGARLLFAQRGARLQPRDREHFGFRDGISQPGIRGRLSGRRGDFLTRRENPDETKNEGKPGQALLWPGEFVFGYPGQDPLATGDGGINKPGECSLTPGGSLVAPPWARNGSYLVFRRLRQEVGAFRSFVSRQARALGIAPALLEAKLVGRFKSGAPLARTSEENATMGADGCANNDFLCARASPALSNSPTHGQCSRTAPTAESDLSGERCPFSAHIRKGYPRDDTFRFDVSGGGNRTDTESHRILRRGIPFGPPYPAEAPFDHNDGQERGLLFMCYQTSIVEQFEHIQRHWANAVELRRDGLPKEVPFGAGYDPIIGQSPEGRRQFVLKLPELGLENGAPAVRLLAAPPFVVPTGGGYFFVPSLSAVAQMARAEI
jgi:Dyp-type peroxidase family